MFKRIVVIGSLTAGVLALGVSASPARMTGGSQCLGPDSNSTAIVNWVRNIIKSTDVHVDSLRNKVGLGGVDTLSVSLVTTSRTCASAATAIDQLANISTSGRLVYVVQAGNKRYIVQDPNDAMGNATRTWVFDNRFNVVAALSK